VRRAVGATKLDIMRQFIAESVLQCIAGGLIASPWDSWSPLALRTYTTFPASVQRSVAVLGEFLSSAVGLFFGIYPALRAATRPHRRPEVGLMAIMTASQPGGFFLAAIATLRSAKCAPL